MAKAFADLADAGQAKDLAHADWLALLLDREGSWRRDKRLTARLRAAKLRQQASVEDVDYRATRGLDRALFQKLSEGDWIDAHDNLALVGPSGVGKSWLACAIGQKACRDNRSVLYHRWPKLCEDLALATICSKSSKSGMDADRRSSPHSSRCPPGTRSSATPLTPTPFWTASCTTPIAS